MLLKTIKTNNIYEVRVESNNKLIGKFIPGDDGFFYFDCNSGGLWGDYVLIELGTILKEINKPWRDNINEYFEKEGKKDLAS